MNIIQSLMIAIAMYSKVPMPKIEWNEKNMKYAMCFFPFVGVILGLCSYAVFFLLMKLSCGVILIAGVMSVLPILITGGIHMDGFMDTMDALHSYGEREKKLEILKDPNTGAFAVIGITCYFVLSVALWTEVKSSMMIFICLGYVLSRSLSALSIVTFPAARKDGLARTFQDQAKNRMVQITMVIYLVAVAIAMMIIDYQRGLAVILICAASFFYYRHMCQKQFGGVTGDLAGYFLVLCEFGILAVNCIIR